MFSTEFLYKQNYSSQLSLFQTVNGGQVKRYAFIVFTLVHSILKGISGLPIKYKKSLGKIRLSPLLFWHSFYHKYMYKQLYKRFIAGITLKILEIYKNPRI